MRLDFLATETDEKHDFFRVIEMALTNIVNLVLMEKLVHKSFERWTQTELLTNQLAEEVCKNPSLSKRVLETTNINEVKGTLVQNDRIQCCRSRLRFLTSCRVRNMSGHISDGVRR